MYIYKITNKLTNEVYIGQTRLELAKRLQRHISDARASLECRRRDFPYFHRKLMFYGPEHFYIELIEEVSKEQADAREIYWIKYYNSYEQGYNSTLGGQNQIKEQQEQIRAKWAKPQFKNPIIQKPGIQKNQAAAKPVICYDDDGLPKDQLPSIRAAAEKYNVSAQMISRALHEGGNTLSARLRWRYASDNITSLEPLLQKPNCVAKKIPDTRKIILQYTKNKEFLKEWINAEEAANALNINKRCIIYTCNGKQKTAGGYFWQFKT